MRIMLFQSLADRELSSGVNTFRAGDKWGDLRPGEEVSIALTAAPETSIGVATVRGVVVDTLGILLAAHAHNNHAIMKDGVHPADAMKQLKEALDGIYGAQEGHETFTAVYLDIPE